MERILLVEDNTSLSQLISLKISKELSFEVDIAYSMKEAKLFLRQYKYFVALLDINLPDAPNGEIVDYVIETKTPCIVLSGKTDKAFRTKFLNKDIIDYVNKGGIEDIDYTINIISRLSKNIVHKVMIVDDSMVFRNLMKKMMNNMFFEVIAVGHGEEALLMLEENPDIKLILTDYAMPVMNGLELTKAIRKTHKKTTLSILAISSNEDSEVSAMFLKNGATDFIKKPFSKEEFSCRINNAIEALENIDALTNHSKRDPLTGLYNRKHFYKHAQTYYDKAIEVQESFCIVMLNIDNLKSINEAFSHEVGDKLVIHLSELLHKNCNLGDLLARLGEEGFCIILKNISSSEAKSLLESIRHKIEVSPFILNDETEIKFTISLGAVSRPHDSLEDTLNQTDLSLHNAKHAGKNQLVFE